jgi:hypothetical protein
MSESDELDELGDSNGRKSVSPVLRTGSRRTKKEEDDQEGEEGVEEGEDAKARRIAAEDKELRIIPRDRAVKIWTTELGNPAATFQWDPDNHREFKCGVCYDTPSIRCKAMTLRQHCKRNKHTEALKGLVGRGGGNKEEEEEKPLVKQAAVFSVAAVQGSNKKKTAKKKRVTPPPEPSDDDDDDEQDEEEEVKVKGNTKKATKKKKTPPPPVKKRERAPHPPKKAKKNSTPSPKKKKQKAVEEDQDRVDDDDVIDIAPVSRDLEDDWKRYVAKNLGPKQREAMFARRLRRIMDEFEGNGKK